MFARKLAIIKQTEFNQSLSLFDLTVAKLFYQFLKIKLFSATIQVSKHQVNTFLAQLGAKLSLEKLTKNQLKNS